jgi:MFS family permease
MADWIGRTPVIAFGMSGLALSTVLFGFSNTYAMAFSARFLGNITSLENLKSDLSAFQVVYSAVSLASFTPSWANYQTPRIKRKPSHFMISSRRWVSS